RANLRVSPFITAQTELRPPSRYRHVVEPLPSHFFPYARIWDHLADSRLSANVGRSHINSI
ncbi:MAG: hypothetical protein WC003_14970, partial [Terrimicrobiaceae bacterium]